MVDDQDDQEDLAQLVARSNALQMYILDVLGAGDYHAAPTLVIHALCEMTSRIMAIEAQRDPHRRTFVFLQLDYMKDVVTKAAGELCSDRAH